MVVGEGRAGLGIRKWEMGEKIATLRGIEIPEIRLIQRITFLEIRLIQGMLGGFSSIFILLYCIYETN